MPISLTDLMAVKSQKRSTDGKVNKNILDVALTGNGNNSRGYVNQKNGHFWSFLEDNIKMISQYQSDKDYIAPNVKTTILHPYDITNSNIAGNKLIVESDVHNQITKHEHALYESYNTLSNTVVNADKSAGVKYNDLFNAFDEDSYDVVVNDHANSRKLSMKVIPTALHRLSFKKDKHTKKVFQTSGVVVIKATGSNPDADYHYYDSIRNADDFKIHPSDANIIYVKRYNSMNELSQGCRHIRNDLLHFASDKKNIVKDNELDTNTILQRSTQEMTDHLCDTYVASANYITQKYDFSSQLNTSTIEKHDNLDEMSKYLYQINVAIDKLPKNIQDYLSLVDYQNLFKAETAINEHYLKLNESEFGLLLTLNLSLNNNLNKLDEKAKNHELYEFKAQNQQALNLVNNSKNFSKDQKAIITETKPLVVGVAGAGSGKSHTIIGRLAYLQQQAEDMSKVLVLSFTNTAADNIRDKYPSVRSLTLSKLFHEIYQINFADHALSDDKVLEASLQLIEPKSDFFINRNLSVDEVDSTRNKICSILNTMNSYRPTYSIAVCMNALSDLINNHFDTVIALLDGIKQTSITLEPIIINSLLMNQSLDSLKIPDEIQDINFIITDESQDISTFEYVLLTELTAKYNANLMIVGDATQTLYEFRDSNPDFLNTIEASGIFELHRLNRNYRSNADILAMSNQFLDVIEANRYAQIRLQSNSLVPVSADSFKDHVILNNMVLDSADGNKKDYIEDFKKTLSRDRNFIDWLVKKINRGDQVGIMAFTKAETKAVEEVVDSLRQNPAQFGLKKDIKLGSLIRDQKRPSSLGTDIMNGLHLSDVSKRPVIDANLANFKSACKSQAAIIMRKANKIFVPYYVTNTIDQFVKSNSGRKLIQAAMQNQADATRLYKILTDAVIKAEIRVNQRNTYLSLTTDDEDDNNYVLDNCNVVTTTIHSAKGLEFDDTIVVHRQSGKKNSTNKAYEEKLRLYGVALTRAKQEEYIINTISPIDANNSVTHSQIGMYVSPMQTAYARVLDDIRGVHMVQP